MHPAYSVIFFTTASGAGYGLLAWLAVAGALGLVEPSRGFGIAAFGLAFVLITAGLLSSTAHLGRPERAWRAFSQWRSSWLSREGVLAVAFYLPAGLFALGWVVWQEVWLLAAVATLVLAFAVVWCTGMIYASLPTIRAWHHPLVAPIYVALALATGGVLLAALLALAGEVDRWVVAGAFLALLVGGILKARYWSTIDTAERTSTVGSATGLGRFGVVRPLDPPHTQPNFVMREMGFAVARKHAMKLRALVLIALFHVPALALLLTVALPLGLAAVVALVAMVSAAIGVALERWLFFAEAEHVAMLFYGRDAA